MNRDYTNPFLPVNPSAIEGALQVTFMYQIHFHFFILCILVFP